MTDIIRINLDNEMDLILAHKRTMKLSELCGLSVPSQTTFATAVSEIARCAINVGKKSHLILSINSLSAGKKELRASLFDLKDLSTENLAAFSFAKRLMGDLHAEKSGDYFVIILTHTLPFSGTISDLKIKSFQEYFKNERPLSPYDEIRKKNIQLIDLARKLQESEKQYRMLSDTLPLMMFSINEKGEVNYSNKWLKDFFGFNGTQASTATWQSMVHPEDNRVMRKDWERSLNEKTTFRAQGRLRDKNRNYVWHLITIVPVKNEQNEIVSSIGFFVDIHSQKLVEETLKDNKELIEVQKQLQFKQLQLEQKIGELHISNVNLEQFAFIASHDLQEPLRKIKTFANLLEMDISLNEKQARYFKKIQDSSNRMSNLIRDVLNYSKLSQADTVTEETDLNDIVEGIKIDLELLIAETGTVIATKNLPVVKAMPLQMIQLFSNLIHNSIKFSEQKPEINIACREMKNEEVIGTAGLDPAKNYFNIAFSDNGIGFNQEYTDKIFTIFQRLGDTDSGGTGIGLALCKKIVENHNGIITAESKPGEGATFNVYLPIETAINQKLLTEEFAEF